MALIIIQCVPVFLSQPAYADKQVFEPYAEQGEWELESTGLYDFDHSKNKNAVQEYKNAIGYGVNSFWHTELEVETETEPTDNTITPFKATHMEFEKRFSTYSKRAILVGCRNLSCL